MSCTKCGGLVVAGDFDDEQKCLQCGKRSYRTEGEPVKGGRAAESVKASLNDAPARRGWSPERRAKFLATVRRKRGLPSESGAVSAEEAARLIDASRPAPTGELNGHAVNWAEWRRHLLAQLDQAIGQLEAQLTKTKAARAAVEAL